MSLNGENRAARPERALRLCVAITTLAMVLLLWPDASQSQGQSGAQQKPPSGFECSDRVQGWHCPELQALVDESAVVNLRKGIYEQCAVIDSPTVINGNGSIIQAKTCQGKAAFVTRSDTFLENLVCRGHSVADGNGACVRQQQGKLLLRNVEIRDSQSGALAGPQAGDLTIEASLLESLGGDCRTRCGRAHSVYYGGKGVLRIHNSTIRRPRDQGHLIKSGASRTILRGVTLHEEGGGGSRVIDLYNGGVLVLRNSTIMAHPGDGNSQVIGYDHEARQALTPNRITMRNTRIDCAGGPLLGGGHSLRDAELNVEAARTNCR